MFHLCLVTFLELEASCLVENAQTFCRGEFLEHSASSLLIQASQFWTLAKVGPEYEGKAVFILSHYSLHLLGVNKIKLLIKNNGDVAVLYIFLQLLHGS